MKTLFVLFVISIHPDAGVGLTYEFSNLEQCMAVAKLIDEDTMLKKAFCVQVVK